ncbi:TonB-dependent receptor [Aestuariicella hydrocarbonica]|uniref:TonB-dependent receptor n=1 Tax=Pseudomaricurvus hydrocarbonicus TaxID=1470433 RepID=A0A9E5JPQ2_9GAMM|nr:TonB-dependent receptor [Aestuariicella hydrocarbonica]NHO64347.1 TonB-dependent receptor [Aestuariicella hydrocarbonica]
MKKPYLAKHPLAGVIAVTIALSGSHAVFAQDSKIVLEEVIVTAQKREQNIQDVPVAVTAFSAADLNNAGVQDVTEVQRSAPNVTMQVSRGTNTTLTAYVRGIGQADPLWGFEPGVGLYVDDVYLARPQGGVLDVFDVERIEVLRGPQGTLYGKNTIGGAVKYVTKRLTGEPELSINGSLGSYNQRDLKIAGQLPLIEDKLLFGASVAQFKRDGFGEFLLNGDDNYNKDVTAARVSLEFLPTDNLSLLFSADKTEDDSNAKGGYRMTPSLLIPAETPPSSVFDTYADMPTYNSVESSGASLTVSWDINEALTLKSITAYREGDTFTNIDFDNTSLPSAHVPAVYADDQTTQEFQLSYTGDKLAMVGGLYYYEGSAAGAFDVLLGAYNVAGPFDPSLGIFDALSAGSVDTTSYAAYMHATYTFNDSWALTLGGRYTQDEKDADVYKEQLFVDGTSAAVGGEDLFSLAVLTDYQNDNSWSQFSPRVSVDFSLNDDIMMYASYSQGFKSGGFDMRGDATANPGTVNGFDPEIVDTVEFGVKAELWDGRVRMNAATFYSEYTDMQVTVQEGVAGGTNYVSSVLNAGESEIRGFELEAIAQITEGLSANLMVGYIDAEYITVDNETPNGVENIADDWSFANTPEKVASFKLNYASSLGNWGDIAVSAGASYRSETQIFQVASAIDEDSYTLWDASAVWYSSDEHWTVGLHGKNLTDEEYRVGGYNFANLGGDEVVVGYYGNPRTVSLNFGYRF